MSLCALLMMRSLDVDLDTALSALGDFEPLAGRGAVRSLRVAGGAITLVDESYNASPVSVIAAVASLGARATLGRRIVALTDMLELGEAAPALHAALADQIDKAGIDLVFCAGPLMRSLWDVLPTARRGAWAADALSMAPALADAVRAGDTVMVKGSNASRADILVRALADRDVETREGG
jgi:UDP-N-acetylmuramoyl-tripeptide--D-alanyl-D-alanine ligase